MAIIARAWIQLSVDPERAGSTTVVITVNDIEEQHQICESLGFPIGEVVEYPEVIKLAKLIDPVGNKVSFVQDISQ